MFLRSLVFLLLFYGLTALWAIAMLATLPCPSRRPLTQGIRWWCGIVFRMIRAFAGIEVEIRGLEHLPETGPFIVAAKHQSTLDAFALFRCFPGLTSLGKRELFRVPVLGSILRKLGLIPIARDTGEAHRDLPDSERLFVASNRILLLFPEGTRVAVGDSKPLKSGVYHYHRDSGLPVYTMASNGGWRWPTDRLALRPGRAIYEFHEALPMGLDREPFMAELERRIVERSNELVAQARNEEAGGP